MDFMDTVYTQSVSTICEQCMGEMVGRRADARFCSKRCQERSRSRILIPEKEAARKHAYYAANREKAAEQGRTYRAANVEKIAEQGRVYRAANSEKRSELARIYNAANHEKIAEKTTAWRKANRDLVVARKRARKDLRTYGGPRPIAVDCIRCGVAVDLTATSKSGRITPTHTRLCRSCRFATHGMSVAALVKRDGVDCGICHAPVDLTLRRPNLLSPSVDHVHPRSRGGSDDPENLQLAHLRCNMIKNDRVALV